MSNDTLIEYKNKLQKSKQQLKKVKQLLTQQPQNENLLQLKRDLEEVISVTETLIQKKKEKSFDDKTSSQQVAPTQTQTQTHTHATSAMFVSSQPPTPALHAPETSSTSSTPREWGVQKEEYEIGERCQVKWQSKWMIGRICGIASHGTGVPVSGVEYTVLLVQKNYEVTVALHDIRTYVAPLPSQLHVGLKVNALWHRDERFYPAIIEEANEAQAQYKIKFERYHEYASVNICDIQLLHKHKKEHLHGGGDALPHHVVKQNAKTGELVIAEKAVIPSGLWSKDDDTPDLRQHKRKKIKSIKRQHRDLKMEVESKNRANQWQQFKSKNLKKHSKKMKNSLLSQTNSDKKSIFQHPSSSLQNASMIIESNANMTQFTQRTHFHHLKKPPASHHSPKH